MTTCFFPVTVVADVTPVPPPPVPEYGPDPTTVCPGGAVHIAPGTDIQTVVNGNPAGTVYCLQAGTHRLQSIIPKAGDQFWGEFGAVLSGARLLTGWVFDGTNYFVTGQTQQGVQNGPTIGGFAVCQAGFDRCYFPEDLFVNDVPYRHVSSIGALGPGNWFFDYAADRIYIRDNPTGQTVETSVTAVAFSGTASGVQIRNLVIEKYAAPTQEGAIKLWQGWTLFRCDVRFNHWLGVNGIVGASGKTVQRCRIHDNGSLGIAGNFGSSLVDHNEVSYNNFAHANAGFEAGGSKFFATDTVTISNNWFHHNFGPGIWCDIDNNNHIIEFNLSEDNGAHDTAASPGIFWEISYKATIRNNTCRRNGLNTDTSFPPAGAGIWISSAGDRNVQSTLGDSEVHDNIVEDNRSGIMLFQDNRPWITANVLVHDNVVKLDAVQQQGATRFGTGPEIYSRNNRFENNTYNLQTAPATPFTWNDVFQTDAAWRAIGHDDTGIFNR